MRPLRTVESPAPVQRFPLLILVAVVATVVLLKTGVFDSKKDPVRKVGGPSTSAAADARSGKAAGNGEPGDVSEAGSDGPVSSATGEAESDTEADLPLGKALGQMMVARFAGEDPAAGFLDRIRKGEIGGVILFEENLQGGRAAIAKRIDRLQSAALKGGNPLLLVMVDQEGGPVRRLPGPPRNAPRAMDSGEQAREEGEATGDLLHQLGINVDLAPVADVGHPGSFLKSRTFSSSPAIAAERACEFSAGLQSEGVAATLKHFPGLGMAATSTDEATVTIEASPAEIRADYTPYRACGSQPLTLVMVDSAIYPSLTGPAPAVMSAKTYDHELPLAGVTGVTISDALESPPIEAQTTPARHSVNAGLDLLLYAKSESTSAAAFSRLLEDAQTGAIDRQAIATAAAKILALKEQLDALE